VGVTDIVAVAKGVGLTNSHWVRDEAHFMQLLDRRFSEGGPLLLGVKIDDKPGPIVARPDPDPQRLHEGARDQPRRGAGRLSSARFVPNFVTGTERTPL
jgi:hypothetical protein